jgi:tetratricopeptide (TPR) repeat protein
VVEQHAGSRHECLGPELIAGYLDGRLSANERELVELHLATCDDCREVVAEAFQVNRALDEEGATAEGDEPADATRQQMVAPIREAHATQPASAPLVRWPSRTAALWGSILAAAAAVLLVLWLDPAWLRDLRGGSRGTPPELRALVTAVGTGRYVEPRLAGGFAWAPPPAVLRSGDGSRSLPLQVRMAIAKIEQSAEAQSTPESLHVLGLAHMIDGQADKAVTTLERAAETRPGDASLRSDLAAAYLVRAARSGTQNDTDRALAAAGRAATIDPSLPEAWFNLALAREAAGRREAAREAWFLAAALDHDVGWRAEARQHATR